MKKNFMFLAAVIVIYGSFYKSYSGDVFAFSYETSFSKAHIPPNFPGKWLFLGCDSIIPVVISLKNSGDEDYPYKIKTDRKLPKPDSACDKGVNIIIRNIKDILPGRFSIAREDSINDSTDSYSTDKDTVKVIKGRSNEGYIVSLSFTTGSEQQVVKNEDSESAYVYFAGDINKDNHVDFVIIWMNTYANQYETYISRIDKGKWQLKKEAETVYSD